MWMNEGQNQDTMLFRGHALGHGQKLGPVGWASRPGQLAAL